MRLARDRGREEQDKKGTCLNTDMSMAGLNARYEVFPLLCCACFWSLVNVASRVLLIEEISAASLSASPGPWTGAGMFPRTCPC